MLNACLWLPAGCNTAGGLGLFCTPGQQRERGRKPSTTQIWGGKNASVL